MIPRSSGLLLHVTSLPSGTLGREAFRFVDFCASAGQRWWQLLPVAPPGYGSSPYSALSAFAGNEAILDKEAGEKRRRHGWLEDYALFRAIRAANGEKAWTRWPRGLRDRDPDALALARQELAREMEGFKRAQRRFDYQWSKLKRYANQRGVGLIGDLPLFVAHDSADVWANRGLFKLDKAGRPTVVTGVPPDYFSRSGQRWGNPHYRWPKMRREGYRWWIARLKRMFELFDAVRIDHFLGLLRAWEVPARARTAKRGKWAPGPGASFLEAVRKQFKGRLFIAEDLGLVTKRANEMRERFGLPGMRVLHFSFGEDPATRPHFFPRGCVVYTGTHDNDTSAGWYRKGGADAARARRYAGCGAKEIHWGLIRVAHLSPADLAIVPVQDLLGLGSGARMNRPGSAGGNWRWRLKKGQLTAAVGRRLREVTEIAGR
ncbi:MAG: 4-alpha-glucanotransferase [Planctomycetota bacterium]